MSPYCFFVNIMYELGLWNTPTIARQDQADQSSIDLSMHLCCGLRGTCSISVWDLEKIEIWNPSSRILFNTGVSQVSRQFTEVNAYIFYPYKETSACIVIL